MAAELTASRTLFIFEGGGNDFIYNNTLSPSVVIDSLLNGVRDLLALSAKNILVSNQPPLDKFPFARLFHLEAVFAASANTSALLLTNYLKTIRNNYPQASLNIFDINSLITKVVSAPTTYFTNVTANCWSTINPGPVVKLCSDPKKYVFIDESCSNRCLNTLFLNRFTQNFIQNSAHSL
jgi:phospholipase/lecithinase/hemolysin